MSRRFRNAAVIGLVAGLVSAVSPAWAQDMDPAAFYKGKTVHFSVGYSPGGGYDGYARLLAPHFEKATGATVVVENKPGAGGIIALNQLARGVADGLAFQLANGEASLLSQLIDQPGVAYDMKYLSMIARVENEPYFLLFNNNMPDDLKNVIASRKKMRFSATSRTDGLASYAAVTCEALQMNCQIITGYKGSKEASLAMLNGEADALVVSESSGLRYSYDGKAKIIITIGQKRSSHKPDVPTVYEAFDLLPEQKWWFDFRLGISTLGRAIIGPPGIPAGRLAYLQRVWKDILTDQGIIDELANRKMGINYASPEMLKKAVDDGLGALPSDKRKIVKEIFLQKFSPN